MNNHITAHMLFYFKGEKKELSSNIDLDSYMQTTGGIPPVYTMLARDNNIDIYSYEYEIMEMEKINFSNATGLASAFLVNGNFDTEGFMQKWHEENLLAQLADIAQRHMKITDIDAVPGLKQTLLDVYKLKQ